MQKKIRPELVINVEDENCCGEDCIYLEREPVSRRYTCFLWHSVIEDVGPYVVERPAHIFRCKECKEATAKLVLEITDITTVVSILPTAMTCRAAIQFLSSMNEEATKKGEDSESRTV